MTSYQKLKKELEQVKEDKYLLLKSINSQDQLTIDDMSRLVSLNLSYRVSILFDFDVVYDNNPQGIVSKENE